MTERPYQILARDRETNFVSQVFRHRDGIVRSKEPLSSGAHFSRDEAKAAKDVAERKDWALYVTKRKRPFIVVDDDTKMVRAPLARKINELGREVGRYIWMGEGWRSHARQWELYREYEARNFAPPVVAYPGTSNHETGWAADISVLLSGRGGDFVNVGDYRPQLTLRKMRKLGLGLPVPGEAWHVQITDSMRGA